MLWAEKHGHQVLLTIFTSPPEWACEPGTQNPSYPDLCALDEAYVADFSNYVRQLLERVGSRIEKIQLGNEWGWEIRDVNQGDNWKRYERFADTINDAVNDYNETHDPDIETALGAFTTGEMDMIGLCMNLDEPELRADLAENGWTLWDCTEPRRVELQVIEAFCADWQEGTVPYMHRVLLDNVLKNIDYQWVSMHLYDNPAYWHWQVRGMKKLVSSVHPTVAPRYLVSEFGGHSANGWEPGRTPAEDYCLEAGNLNDYLSTLADISLGDPDFVGHDLLEVYLFGTMDLWHEGECGHITHGVFRYPAESSFVVPTTIDCNPSVQDYILVTDSTCATTETRAGRCLGDVWYQGGCIEPNPSFYVYQAWGAALASAQ